MGRESTSLIREIPSPQSCPSSTSPPSHNQTMPPKRPHRRNSSIRSHLPSWVMLSPTTTPPYTPLPNESTLLTSTPRIALSLTTPAHYPGKQQQPFTLNSASGLLYLTNRRILYLPDKTTPQLQSFAAPILNLHDSHVTAPWFGANVWTALLQPTAGGGIPVPSSGVVEIRFTFKEGGAFDFHTAYERVRERLNQALEVQRSDGGGAGGDRAGAGGVDAGNVNLDDLPAYQEENDGPLMSPVVAAATANRADTNGVAGRGEERTGNTVPDEAPPGYEEAQMEGLREEVERRASESR